MQMQLQDMYQSYYDADPENRTPPIPTAQVVPPVSTQRLQQLCYSHTRVPTEAELTDTAYAILDALHELETTVPQGDRIRGVVERSGASFYASPGLQWMGEYMIKREFSEGSHHVFGISLPKLLPEPIEASHCHTDLNLQHTNASTTMTSHNMATDMGNPEQSSLTSCPLDQDAEPVQITIPSYVWQLLWETASRLLTESCGESWLLQPKIASMTRLEYRVYLLGGVSGVQNPHTACCCMHSSAVVQQHPVQQQLIGDRKTPPLTHYQGQLDTVTAWLIVWGVIHSHIRCYPGNLMSVLKPFFITAVAG